MYNIVLEKQAIFVIFSYLACLCVEQEPVSNILASDKCVDRTIKVEFVTLIKWAHAQKKKDVITVF